MHSSDSWFIFQDGQLILSQDNQILSDASVIIEMRMYFIREHSLGVYNGVHCHCVEISSEITLPNTLQRQPLRRALDILDSRWYIAASRAASLLNWDRTHRFCGSCGKATIQKVGATEKFCPHCDLIFYPRISPSIIVLINKGEEILMARSPHFTPGAYGLIAGFVEAGESLENAIHREVKEEVNIEIKNIRYYGSQSWPFPDSLMIAFFAEYAGGELIIDQQEIETAGWFHYNNLPGRPSTKNSIGSKLLDEFISQQTK